MGNAASIVGLQRMLNRGKGNFAAASPNWLLRHTYLAKSFTSHEQLVLESKISFGIGIVLNSVV